MTQFQKITLEDAIARYKEQELTAKGLLRLYVEIKLKPGWDMRKSPQEIYTEIGISRTAFYRAYAALRTEGKIEGDNPDLNKLVIKRPILDPGQQSQSGDDQSQSGDDQSQPGDDQSQIWDSQSQPGDDQSQIWESKSSNPPELRDSGHPSDSSSNLYSNSFSNSLSDKEREKKENRDFFNSQEQVVKEAILLVGHQYYIPRLKETPALTDKWIECNAIEIYRSPYCPVEFSKITSGKYSENFFEKELLQSMIQSKIIAGLTPTKVIDLDGTTKPVRRFLKEDVGV